MKFNLIAAALASLSLAGAVFMSTEISKLKPTPAEESFDTIYSIYNDTDKYIDKDISIEGYYSNSLLLEDGTIAPESEALTYHFLTVFDKYNANSLSIEFTYDGEYPEIGDYISISGTFDVYSEEDITYFNLNVKDLEILTD